MDLSTPFGYKSSMAHPLDTLTTQALDSADRLALANRLIDSVEGPEDPEWADAWAAELERRYAEVQSGAVQRRSWEDVRAGLLASLKR